MSHHSLETRAAETLPDSISMVVWTRNNRSWLSLGLKVTVPQQLYQLAARPQSQSLYGLGPAHGGSFGCWLTSYSLCLPTRNQAELAWGKNSLWGETPPSAMCFPCTDALFQAPATMADKFSCSCTPLRPGFRLYSSFLQTAVSEIFIRIRKTS